MLKVFVSSTCQRLPSGPVSFGTTVSKCALKSTCALRRHKRPLRRCVPGSPAQKWFCGASAQLRTARAQQASQLARNRSRLGILPFAKIQHPHKSGQMSQMSFCCTLHAFKFGRSQLGRNASGAIVKGSRFGKDPGRWPRLGAWYEGMDAEFPAYSARVRGDERSWQKVLAQASPP